MDNFNNYFNRQIELWGLDTQKNLQNKKILIVGCGGLGCSLGLALGSSGIGRVDLIDFDTVALHNIHRQIAFKTKDQDKNKAKVLKELILDRCPYVKIDSFEVDFVTFISTTTTKYDLIVDATDNLQVRVEIDKFAKQNNIPWVYGSVEEFHGQICFFQNANFESVFNISNHKPKGIAAPIVMNIASFQANLVLRYLVNLPIKKDFLYYCFFNQDGIFETQKFGLPTT